VEDPDVPFVESLKDELLFPKNRNEVVAHQHYGGTTTQQKHPEGAKLCGSRANKLFDPRWWNRPLWLDSPPAQPPDTVGATEEEEA